MKPLVDAELGEIEVLRLVVQKEFEVVECFRQTLVYVVAEVLDRSDASDD